MFAPPLILLITTFLLLSLSRHQLNKRIFHLSILLTGSRRFAIFLYSLLFLPGTLIHELSHLLFAAFLRVPTGSLSLWPKSDPDSKSIRLGSVKIAKADFIRQSLIGAAPTIIGSFLIYLTIRLNFPQLLTFNSFPTLLTSLSSFLFNPLSLLQSFSLYLIFTISSTLHTSPSDRAGWPLLGLLLGLIFTSAYLLGGLQLIPSGFISLINSLSLSLSLAFTFALSLNLFVILIFLTVETTLSRIIGKHITS